MAGQLSEMIESFRQATEPVREKMDSWKESINGYASKRTEQMYRSVLASPAIFVTLLIIIAAFLGQRGLDFQDQIEDDVEIFLPDGAESTDLLLDWGRVERTRYEYERDVVSASIVEGQYEYFRLNSDRSIKNLETLSRSVWQIQLGIKYDF